MKFNKVVPMFVVTLIATLVLLLQSNGGIVQADDGLLDPATQAALAMISDTNSTVPLQYPEPPLEFFSRMAPNTAESPSLINLDDFRGDGRFSGIDGSGVAIVILDTGIDVDHSFFGPDNNFDSISDRIVYQYDFADGDNDASDVNGHGSNVSSIVGSSDGTYTGMAPDVDIIHLKVFPDAGGGQFSYVESALQWVVTNAVLYNIVGVNMSLGDTANHATEQSLYGINDEILALSTLGVAVVSSSGNDFFSFGSAQGVGYPSADPNSFSVGAVYDSNVGGVSYGSGAQSFSSGPDFITPFSQRHSTLTTIFAPGAPSTGAGPNGGLVTMHGTSQAAPHIAGIIALMQELALQELGRKLTVEEIETLLVSTAVSINDGDNENDNVTNTGLTFPRVDVFAIGEAIIDLTATNPPNITKLNSNADTGDGELTPNEATNVDISQLIVTFSEDVNDPAGDVDVDDVTNIANYLLVSDGANSSFDTTTCGAVQGDDSATIVNSVSYNSSTFTATLSLNNGAPLSEDRYRIFVCKEIEDADDNQLDGDKDGTGGNDFSQDFEIDTTPINGAEITFTGISTGTVTTLSSAISSLDFTFPDKMMYEGSSSFVMSANASMPASAGDVTNINNYQLITNGVNNTFDTTACGATQGDDGSIGIDSVSYNPNTYEVVISFNGGEELSNETYQFLVCGTIEDDAGNAMGSDIGVSFAVNVAKQFIPVVVK